MRAYVMDRYGGPEVMRLGELPEPTAAKGEVVVSVRASTVNPVDWKVRSGAMRLMSGRRFPRALGTEFAGVIQAVGPGVQGWAPGDAVYGLTVTALGRPGAHAERLAVATSAIRHKPEGMSFDVAATLTVAALTALNGLRLAGPLEGRSLLVNGATGGVGHFVVQIARARGARVTAVCSAANADLARGLGAAEVIDYRAQDVTQGTARYDIIYDAFGGMPLGRALGILEPRGVYVTPLGMPAVILRAVLQNILPGKRILIGNVRTEQEDFAAIEALLASGAVKPVINRVVPLERAGEAFAEAERGGGAGKIVVRVGPDTAP